MDLVHGLFQEDLRDEPGETLRVLYFEEQQGLLEPLFQVDRKDGLTLGPKVKEAHVPFFRITKGEAGSTAVYAAKSQRVEIVECAEIARKTGHAGFRSFPMERPSDIGSMIAFPVADKEAEYADRVLCISTSKSGFFRETERSTYEHLHIDIGRRILFESDMQQLLAPGLNGDHQ